jgi:hypothetical protein
VQGDDEVVPRPGPRDVEQADALVVRHLLIDRQPRLECRRAHLVADPDDRRSLGWPRHLGSGVPALRPGREAGDDRDRELEALGCVHRHDAHGVVVGLRQDGLGHAAALGSLLADPLEVLPERPVGGVGPGASLVEYEPHPPPQVTRSALGGPQLEQPPVADHLIGQLAG